LEGRSDALALPVLAKCQRHRPRQGQLDALETAAGRPRCPVAYRLEQWGALDDLDSAKFPVASHPARSGVKYPVAVVARQCPHKAVPRPRCPEAIRLAQLDASGNPAPCLGKVDCRLDALAHRRRLHRRVV
jgi:hypothetical protein